MLFQLCGSSGNEKMSLGDDTHAVGDKFDLQHIVGGEQKGHSVLCGELLYHFADLDGVQNVKTTGRLVEIEEILEPMELYYKSKNKMEEGGKKMFPSLKPTA